MSTINIYLGDLTESKQKEVIEALGDNGNYDVFPIAIIEAEDGDEDNDGLQCPLGGDETDDCADCAYSCDYHFADGECVKRNQ